MTYLAGIVTYNPETERLRQNVAAAARQFDTVAVFDNGSSNVEEIKALLSEFDNVRAFYGEKNFGLSYALNRIMEYAEGQGVEWVLLLDQDSVIPENLLERYTRSLGLEKAAIICPAVYDINGKNEVTQKDSIEKVGICITSGSFNKVSVWREVGCFNEELFIDSIDNEYCIRLYFCGFAVYKDNDVVLNHELGKTEKHLIKSTTNHSAFRQYYIARNCTYVANCYQPIAKKVCKGRGRFKSCSRFLDELISKRKNYSRRVKAAILIALYEKDKIKKIKSIIRGVKDGRKLAKSRPITLVCSL